MDSMKVWIGNLNNDGEMFGFWFELPVDEEDVAEKLRITGDYSIEELDKKLCIGGTENFPIKVPEGVSLGYLNELVEALENCFEEYPQLRFNDWREIFCDFSPFDVFPNGSAELFTYESCTDSELAWEIIENNGGIKQLSRETLEMYFDADAYGHDYRISSYLFEGSMGLIEVIS